MLKEKVKQYIKFLLKAAVAFYVICIVLSCLVITVHASPGQEEAYCIWTRWYERSSCNGQISIKFAKLAGKENNHNFAEINYLLERDAFWLASQFISSEIMEESGTILQALNMLKNQDINVSYNVLYQDEELLSVIIEGRTIHYQETGEAVFFADDSIYSLFDIQTGKKLELSDFVELDMKIIDYKADNYKIPNYNSAAQTLYYSVVDAFGIYENEKYEHHNTMNREEALLMLEEGKIGWAVEADKSLLLFYDFGAEESWIVIPYSYLQDIAKY